MQSFKNVQHPVHFISLASIQLTKMEVTTLTDFRQHMKAYFEKVINLRKPLFITRPKGEGLVILSKSEYNSMEETFFLLKNPKNAERLLAAIEQDKAGKGVIHDIED